jgi:hypothetical protein
LFTATYNFDQFYVGTEEMVTERANFDMYPNPSMNVVNINLENWNHQTASVIFCDMNGRKVYQDEIHLQKGSSILRLDLGFLEEGVYFVSVHADGDTKTRKLIIQ